jgi:hypothetical protein
MSPRSGRSGARRAAARSLGRRYQVNTRTIAIAALAIAVILLLIFLL